MLVIKVKQGSRVFNYKTQTQQVDKAKTEALSHYPLSEVVRVTRKESIKQGYYPSFYGKFHNKGYY